MVLMELSTSIVYIVTLPTPFLHAFGSLRDYQVSVRPYPAWIRHAGCFVSKSQLMTSAHVILQAVSLAMDITLERYIR